MNAEKNTANCWKKAITIIPCILVVSVLKTTTSLQLQLPEQLPPSSRRKQARSDLPRFITSAINRAGSPHVKPGWKSSWHTEAARLM